eukprot:CAMPEP_0198600750 /NCGR_PEP_ID=MMETSP1462-20131121/148614_1 /TAXON_ID=1333877 /ORGANISM="Brandtodinium nutriculum, Strain RCC3387" /LENGTH=100 /DNA_ID=CAMNT_0044332467 /DNA_START=106 /DNA_END=404 /DNA_ORIENTATION=-
MAVSIGIVWSACVSSESAVHNARARSAPNRAAALSTTRDRRSANGSAAAELALRDVHGASGVEHLHAGDGFLQLLGEGDLYSVAEGNEERVRARRVGEGV